MTRHCINSTLGPLVLLAGLAAAVGGCAHPASAPANDVAAPALPDTLVSTQWLSEHLDAPGLVVLDCSVLIAPDGSGGFAPVSGRQAYADGHIPGAGFADLMTDLSRGDSELRFDLPPPEVFAAAMGELGVSDTSTVVLYDRTSSAWAARVWWMLRWIGFDRAALLDGGLNAWRNENRPLSTAAPLRRASRLSVRLRPELIADRDTVHDAIGRDDTTLIDALPEAHYRGDMSMYGRPGHIPGAANIPASSLLTDDGHYRSGDALAALFGERRDEATITYCGGGISAASSAFVLTRLGFTNVAVYTASLQEWAADPANPLETTAPTRPGAP